MLKIDVGCELEPHSEYSVYSESVVPDQFVWQIVCGSGPWLTMVGDGLPDRGQQPARQDPPATPSGMGCVDRL
jgi:hypothetical protein